jgi:hypothetical protein
MHSIGRAGQPKAGSIGILNAAYRYVPDVLNKDEKFIPFPQAKRRLVHLGKLNHFEEHVWNK